MGNFNVSVSHYMETPVHSVPPDAKLDAVHARMVELDVSGLPVVGSDEKPAGIITRTDLLRHGRRQSGTDRKAHLLAFSKQAVSEVMTPELLTLPPDAPLVKAARLMVDQRIHRVFVAQDDRLVGVVSTKDLLRAIGDQRVKTPLAELMRTSVFTIRTEDPLSLAAERLEKARVTGLVVVDGQWPVGIFAQREALESRDLPRETPVEDVMSPAMLSLKANTPLHRAASQCAVLGVRRIVIVEDDRMVGVLTGLDLARVIA